MFCFTIEVCTRTNVRGELFCARHVHSDTITILWMLNSKIYHLQISIFNCRRGQINNENKNNKQYHCKYVILRALLSKSSHQNISSTAIFKCVGKLFSYLVSKFVNQNSKRNWMKWIWPMNTWDKNENYSNFVISYILYTYTYMIAMSTCMA